MTLAGLNTINLSQINTFQQFLLFLLTMLGSAIFVSIAVVHIRKKAFARRFQSIAENARRKGRSRSGSNGWISSPATGAKRDSKPEVDGDTVRARPAKSIDITNNTNDVNGEAVRDHPTLDGAEGQSPESLAEQSGAAKEDQTTDEDDRTVRRITFTSPSSPVRIRPHARVFSMQGVGARQNIPNHPKTSQSGYLLSPSAAVNADLGFPKVTKDHFALTGFISRNSQFSSLTLAERERLGGVEYRAVTFLSIIVPTYFFLWQFLGCLGLGAYVANNRASTARDNGLNPWYVWKFPSHQDLNAKTVIGGLEHSSRCLHLTTMV